MSTYYYYQDNKTTIYRGDYPTRYQYLKEYRSLCKAYDFKIRVEGGWIFFRYLNDYLTAKNQK